MNRKFYCIGTRKSNLAICQTKIVLNALQKAYPNDKALQNVQIIPIVTTGDKILQHSLADIGGKGLFAKELQNALLNEEIDFAVHSLKDLDPKTTPHTKIACMLPRDDNRDVLITNCPVDLSKKNLDVLPPATVIGTCSPRRIAQINFFRPDCKTATLRGNINTRLTKLVTQEYDAIILAVAGLKRLNLIDSNNCKDFINFNYLNKNLNGIILNPEIFSPAVGQGVICVEIKENNYRLWEKLQVINDPVTWSIMQAERAMLDYFAGNCHTAIGSYSTVADQQIHITASYFHSNQLFQYSAKDHLSNAEALGKNLAISLLEISNGQKN